MEDYEATWILKPNLCNQGTGIFIFNTVQQLYDFFENGDDSSSEEEDEEEEEDTGKSLADVDWTKLQEEREMKGNISDIKEWVIQKYIEKPLLIDNRKFHLRVYVLAIGALKVYVYQDILALFSLFKYPGGNKDLTNVSAHLTNTCYQKKQFSSDNNDDNNDNNDNEQSQNEMNEDEYDEDKAVKLFFELTDHFTEEQLNSIFDKIKNITGEVFEACSGELGFFPLPNCFEFFGLDFLIEERSVSSSDFNVYFLEANAEPDFMQTGERLNFIIKQLILNASTMITSHFFPDNNKDLDNNECNQNNDTGKFHLVFEQQEKGYMKEASTMKFIE
eukprot:TRINITY_DN2209_c1_g1_i1.p1 TRINITY_DN2209_c1_g1~~TRINITY_DN2209_c1_g1_i1.p1  ORF type:complete len:332 (-),score=129.32 TRINITY_DN2209_c1_g1_i1:51-1046(-)